MEIIKLLRIRQYIKNLFIFAPILFAFDTDITHLTNSLIAFILFSLIASSIYILNDYIDIEEDQKHPTKQFRPLASGTVDTKTALLLALTLSATSLILSALFNMQLFIVLFIYFILNISYSMKLKHIAVVDIYIIATGFVLRLFAGSSVTDIKLSMWIIIMTFLLALFLALAKRRDDVILGLQGKQTRKNIDGYNIEFINASMILMAGVVIVSYIFYTVSSGVIQRLNTENLYLTSFFVILGVLRYMQITFVEENSGSPTKIVFKDTFLKISIIAWLISFILIVKYAS